MASDKKSEPIEHFLVPIHEKLDEKEAKKVLEEHKIEFEQLPQILVSDAAIKHLGPKIGDIIKITRKSVTADTAVFYRGVTDE